jgi:hypothetical protein
MNRPLTEPEARWSLVCIIAGLAFWLFFLGPQMCAVIDWCAQ